MITTGAHNVAIGNAGGITGDHNVAVTTMSCKRFASHPV
jgi:hypothetical protein